MSGLFHSPKTPKVTQPVAPPTIDDAKVAQNERRRINTRRGTLANIYGGASASAPQVGTKTLGGY